jgi:DNA polymerase (family 10)
MNTNKALATLFDHMADLYLLGGRDEDRYRISSYRKIAQTLKYYPTDMATLDSPKKLQEIPGVGPAISGKIHEFITTGKVQTYEKLKKSFPSGLLDLMDVPSLGPKKVQMLWRELGVTNKSSLKKALKSGVAAELPGMGAKSVENILQGLEVAATLNKRKLMGGMYPIVDEMNKYLKASKMTSKLETAGSFRRREETIGDLDFLAISKKPQELIHYFVSHPKTKKILAEGGTKGSIILEGDQQIDLRVVKADEWGAALQYFTGSKEHNIHLRTIAREKGLTINEYGVFKLKINKESLDSDQDNKGEKVAGKTEEEVYKAIGLQFVPPEMRTDSGEIAAAQLKKPLPKLVEEKQIKGDLHSHTTFSDGNNSVLEMAEKADELGMEYLALTDHSPGLIVANGMTDEDIGARSEEIKKVQKKVLVKILSGTEVDIKADGSLDFSEKVLQKMDIVVASVHAGFKKDNTERIIAAMENPYVNIIGHISGRLIGSREAYPIDYELLFSKAVETQTWIEINAQPKRQDISWEHLKKAKEMGVKFVISTDSHHKDTLWFKELGVAIARRGWLEKKDIINTLSKEKFLEELEKQRAFKKNFTKS